MTGDLFSFSWDYANRVVPLEPLVSFGNLSQAKQSLLDKTGPDPQLTDWIPFMDQHAEQALQAQRPLVSKLRSCSNAVVLVGVGGSLLGSMAIYEALSSRFEAASPRLFYAGHHLNAAELQELCQTLQNFHPVLVVISKSGRTLEPALSFRILRQYMESRFGTEGAQQRTIVLTEDSPNPLRRVAQENGYHLVALPSGIGGRYSVFTAAALFPLALCGIDVEQFLKGGQYAHAHCTQAPDTENKALRYAGARNAFYEKGYKIESLCCWDPKLKSLAEWWKQLFGESDGKDGTGLFPASAQFTTDLHSLGQYFQQGERHLFATHLVARQPAADLIIPASSPDDGFGLFDHHTFSQVQQKAQIGTFLAHTEGHLPVLIWEIPQLSAYWLGAWMFVNLFACAVGGYARNINPFNQPGVETYKKNVL